MVITKQRKQPKSGCAAALHAHPVPPPLGYLDKANVVHFGLTFSILKESLQGHICHTAKINYNKTSLSFWISFLNLCTTAIWKSFSTKNFSFIKAFHISWFEISKNHLKTRVKSDCFVLQEWTPFQRKELGIPLGILLQVWEQNKLSYFPRLSQS